MKTLKVISKKQINEVVDVYDISVEKNHQYILENGVVTHNTMDLFAKTIVSGGCLLPEERIITKDGIKEIQNIIVGDSVLTVDGTFKDVIKTFVYDKPTIKFIFDNGATIECSEDHKFLVGDDPFDDSNWKLAKDLNENDSIFGFAHDDLGDVFHKKLRILQKVESNCNKKVCDLCVDGNHTYISENGIINHNSGVKFNSSITMLLSTSKLDDKASEKIAEKKVGDYTKTGVVVTAKPDKSRFTIPQKVRFQIPFFKAPNPYVGLEQYLTWENSGIMRGEILTQKEYDKLKDIDKQLCFEMTDSKGDICYAKAKDTSKKIVVKHLGCELPVTELFTSKVFTDELLHYLDENVIKPNFELPSQDSMMDIEDLLDDGRE